MNKVVRCEYEAWSIITDCFLYEQSKDDAHLSVAKGKFKLLVEHTDWQGGLSFGTGNHKVWVGENGLAAWGALLLYKHTSDSNFLVQAQKWLKYVLNYPPKVRVDEPRLYPVFLTWINYALMEAVKQKIVDWKGYQQVCESNVNEILGLMKRGTHWGICYHYDLYVGRGLLYAYRFFTIDGFNQELGGKCLVALTNFMKASRHSKVPFMNVRPIHYLFFDFRGSGYSTSQYAQLCFEMYLTYYNIDDYLEGKVALDSVKKYLMVKGGVVKRFGDRTVNGLATDWLRYVEVLDKKCVEVALEWI